MAADLALNHGLETNVAVSSGVQHFTPEDDISCNGGCNVVACDTAVDDAVSSVGPQAQAASREIDYLVDDLRPKLSAAFQGRSSASLSSRTRSPISQREVTR
ncbi:hypothetical protein A6U87_22660 [Rhizobium sp. AC44/96]|nr:hypothetical protein A6U87_22660 [Rhizobium sp. AC44/96]